MKKLIMILFGVIALTLFSFSTNQKKVVRLKSGNYKVSNLKMSKKDISALVTILELKMDKKDERIMGQNGYKAYVVEGIESRITFFAEEIGTDVMTTMLYNEDWPDDDEEEGEDDDEQKKEEDKKKEVDEIMSSYL